MTWRSVIFMGLLMVTASGAFAESAEPEEVRLRRWYLGFQLNSGERDNWDVFSRDDLPPASVEEKGGGGAGLFGYRFGDRFLLGLQVGVIRHDMAGTTDDVLDIEALMVGTVLFREKDTFQPFLRGGLGGGGTLVEQDGGESFALGTAVVAAGGFQVRLSSRFSLEWELAARFTNYIEAWDHPADGSQEEWKVKTSQTGWRSGLSLMVWF